MGRLLDVGSIGFAMFLMDSRWVAFARPPANAFLEVQLHIAEASAAWVEEGLLQQGDMTVLVRGGTEKLEAWVEESAEAHQS